MRPGSSARIWADFRPSADIFLYARCVVDQVALRGSTRLPPQRTGNGVARVPAPVEIWCVDACAPTVRAPMHARVRRRATRGTPGHVHIRGNRRALRGRRVTRAFVARACTRVTQTRRTRRNATDARVDVHRRRARARCNARDEHAQCCARASLQRRSTICTCNGGTLVARRVTKSGREYLTLRAK